MIGGGIDHRAQGSKREGQSLRCECRLGFSHVAQSQPHPLETDAKFPNFEKTDRNCGHRPRTHITNLPSRKIPLITSICTFEAPTTSLFCGHLVLHVERADHRDIAEYQTIAVQVERGVEISARLALHLHCRSSSTSQHGMTRIHPTCYTRCQ